MAKSNSISQAKNRDRASALHRSKYRAAIKSLEQIAVREAVGAFYAASNTLMKSPAMKSPVLANATTGTMIRILREAFEYVTAGGAHKDQRKKSRQLGKPPYPSYVRLPK